MRALRLCFTMIVIASRCALADGGYFPVTSGVAETADQRAVIIDHGDTETIVLQTGYDGDASEFAWVIPTPTRLEGSAAVGTADPDLFRYLEDITSPRYYEYSGGGAAVCGCSGGDGGGAGGSPRQGDVTLWDSFSVENYTIAILSAEESGNLATWLGDHGYALPAGAADILDYYVGKQWFFTAIRLSPSDTGGGIGGEELRPLTLRFTTDELVFPMHISRVSTTERVEVRLYVIGDHRVRSSNYATAEIEAGSTWRGDSFEVVYDGWFERTITNAGGTALVVEYAGEMPAWYMTQPSFKELLGERAEAYVTRLRTRIEASQMSEDIVLVADTSGRDVDVIVASGVPGLRPRIAIATLLLGAIQGVAFRRWPRGRRIASATVLLAIFIVLL